VSGHKIGHQNKTSFKLLIFNDLTARNVFKQNFPILRLYKCTIQIISKSQPPDTILLKVDQLNIDTAINLASEVIGMSLDDLSLPVRDLLNQLTEWLPTGKERSKMTFVIIQDDYYPISFRNDYLAINQEVFRFKDGKPNQTKPHQVRTLIQTNNLRQLMDLKNIILQIFHIFLYCC